MEVGQGREGGAVNANEKSVDKIYLVIDNGVVSHGTNVRTGRNVVLPCEPLRAFVGVKRDEEGPYIEMELP